MGPWFGGFISDTLINLEIISRGQFEVRVSSFRGHDLICVPDQKGPQIVYTKLDFLQYFQTFTTRFFKFNSPRVWVRVWRAGSSV